MSPLPAFVPSDFEAAWRTLSAIAESGLATGSYFCEWGSGFGVVTCLAAWLEFTAYGIEIEPDLVEEATKLAALRDLPAEFVCGTFLPHEASELATTSNEFSWLAEGGADAYEELGLQIADFDVIYVFPWPGEAATIEEVFHHLAADGALLLTFDSRGDVRVQAQGTIPATACVIWSSLVGKTHAQSRIATPQWPGESYNAWLTCHYQSSILDGEGTTFSQESS